MDGGRKRRLEFQVNRNTENTTLKSAAAKDSHKVYATVDVDTDGAATAENAKKLFEELKKNVKGWVILSGDATLGMKCKALSMLPRCSPLLPQCSF